MSYWGQPVRGAEGSVGARCLWVILSGYNKPLLRVNGGSLAKLRASNCRLWQTVAAAREQGSDLNFRRLIIRRRPVDVPLERSPAKPVKPARSAQNKASALKTNGIHSIQRRLHASRHCQIGLPALRRRSKTRRALEAAKAACHPLTRRSGRAAARRCQRSARGLDPGTSNAAAAPQQNTYTKSWPRRRAPKR